jgi:hypothetical protein
VQAVLKKCFTAQLILTEVAQHSIHSTTVQVPEHFVYTCPIHAQSSDNNVSISLEEVLNYIYCDDELRVQLCQCQYQSGKEVKIQEFRYRGTTNVEREMYGYTSYNWNHWNSNEKLKEKPTTSNNVR